MLVLILTCYPAGRASNHCCTILAPMLPREVLSITLLPSTVLDQVLEHLGFDNAEICSLVCRSFCTAASELLHARRAAFRRALAADPMGRYNIRPRFGARHRG